MKAKGKGAPVAMTGGMAIVDTLINNGIDTVYGLPGAQLYPLFDALRALRREIAIKRLKKAAKEALIGALDGPSSV